VLDYQGFSSENPEKTLLGFWAIFWGCKPSGTLDFVLLKVWIWG